ncbi:hypothetical protein C9374_009866 [Naegleria lovaniensis]|uniref:Uncharacterized protein n=1 Tax=Naegleria lovaniensis TaxID=51637 RepID=A0AA88KEQ5_NAELO|nr:uncharacterized protein C9374_009866 [Naegleria lovaniensis]KAG2375243.1 hypothetical protein C9374_009866 [Naegleria lovaniensis]
MNESLSHSSAPIILDACKKLKQLLHSSFGPMSFHKLIVKYHQHVNPEMIYTNDGATIVRSLPIVNPIGKILCDLSKTQEELAGDGTTGVILLCCELVLRSIEDLHLKQLLPLEVICNYLFILKNVWMNSFERMRSLESEKISRLIFSDRDSIFRMTQNALQSKDIRYMANHFSNILVDCFAQKIPKQRKFHCIAGGQLNDSFGFRGLFCNVTHSSFSSRFYHSQNLQARFKKCNKILLLGRKNQNVNNFERSLWKSIFQTASTYDGGIIIFMEGAFPNFHISYHKDSAVFIFDNMTPKILHQMSVCFDFPILKMGSVSQISIDDLFSIPAKTRSEDCPTIQCIAGNMFVRISNTCQDLYHFVLRGPSDTIVQETKRSLKDAYEIIKNHFALEKCNDIQSQHYLCGGGCHIEFQLWADIIRENSQTLVPANVSEVFGECILSLPRMILQSTSLSTRENEILRLKREYLKHDHQNTDHKEGASCFYGIDLLTSNCNSACFHSSQSLIVENVLERFLLEDSRVKQHLVELACETAITLLRISSVEV